jgi:hypothetical protein
MRLRTKLAALAVTAGVALTASAAFALWSASGGGTGAATATNSKTITGSAASAGENVELYPGGPAASVRGTLSNSNRFPVNFTGWSGAVVDSVVGDGCAATNFTIAAASGTQSIDVPAQATASTVTLPGVVRMNSDAPNACQNAVVNVTFTLDGGMQKAA